PAEAATQNSPKAISALATEPGSVNSRAKISGASTKAFLIHCLGRASVRSPTAGIVLVCVVIPRRCLYWLPGGRPRSINASGDRLYNHCLVRDGGESRRPGAHGPGLARRLPDRALGVRRHRRRPDRKIPP